MERTESERQRDDAALAERAATGDHAAFAAIMRANNQSLFRVARSILRDDADAEDALQASYLKAYVALPRFAGRSSLSTWLTRIVMNECFERRRATRRRDATPAEPGAVDEVADASPQTDPEAHAARHEVGQLIEQAIDALPESFRLVFTLRAIDGRTMEEIAADLAIPAATVRTRYHRARQVLQERLMKEFRAALDGVFPFAGARCDRLVARVLAALPAAAPRYLH